MAAAEVMVKEVPELLLPAAVVIPIGPLPAPGITKAVTEEAEEEITRAATPPTVIPVGLARLFPLMLIRLPTGPEAGEKDVISGLWALERKKGSIIKSRIAAPLVKIKRIGLNIISENRFIFLDLQK
jgi:hypothetical protein